ncbi:MAG: hypothetical protein EZS28_011862, partial [Streblomastix strix]
MLEKEEKIEVIREEEEEEDLQKKKVIVTITVILIEFNSKLMAVISKRCFKFTTMMRHDDEKKGFYLNVIMMMKIQIFEVKNNVERMSVELMEIIMTILNDLLMR